MNTEIVITVEGGVIQNIENIPEGIIIKVIDFDTEGAEDNITMVDNEPAFISYW